MAGWLTGRPSLLCDLDGTLVDSLTALRNVHRTFLRTRGAEPQAGEFERYNGILLRDVLVALKSTYALEGDPSDLLAEYEALVDDAYLDVLPNAGAVPLLEHAFARGWGVAIVTSGRRDRAAAWLTRHGLAPFVHTVVGAEDATRGKPDPAPYASALEAVGADPRSSWAVEDSDAGIISAAAAGVARVVLVGQEGQDRPEVTRCRDLIAVRELLEAEEPAIDR